MRHFHHKKEPKNPRSMHENMEREKSKKDRTKKDSSHLSFSFQKQNSIVKENRGNAENGSDKDKLM